MPQPFVEFIVAGLELVHPVFAGSGGLDYNPDEVASPLASRKLRERPFAMELYHQLRRLWDKALPVQLGLGHIVTRPDLTPRQPDLVFWQLGENDSTERKLGAVSVVCLSNTDTLEAELALLTRYRTEGAYPNAVCIGLGPTEVAGGFSQDGLVTRIGFDVTIWKAVLNR